jgi:hypothetical protein
LGEDVRAEEWEEEIRKSSSMQFGKTIRIFLIEGDPNGRMTCELSNWSGKAYKIPRIKVNECTDRADLKNTGVYLLLGKDENDKDQVYIGEAESVLRRLGQQLNERDFWNEAIVFISKDNNLNKAHVKYLENRLHFIAQSAKRYKVENSSVPTQSSISESDVAEMEEYIENIKMLVNTLGHKIFDEKRELSHKQQSFYIKAARGAEAQGEPTSDGFLVFQGSKASLTTVNSLSTGFANQRNRLIEKGILVSDGNSHTFSEDQIFASPSTAAVMVMGRNANGLSEWKLQDGTTLRDYESAGKSSG